MPKPPIASRCRTKLGHGISAFAIVSSLAFLATREVGAQQPAPQQHEAVVVPREPASGAPSVDMARCITVARSTDSTKVSRPQYMPNWNVTRSYALPSGFVMAARDENRRHIPIGSVIAYSLDADRKPLLGASYKGQIICFFEKGLKPARFIGLFWRGPDGRMPGCDVIVHVPKSVLTRS